MFSNLKKYDLEIYKKFPLILGIDEVGRGCVAGPLVVCGVILDPNFYCEDIKDSKKIKSIDKRKQLKNIILKNCLYSNIVIFNADQVINPKQCSIKGFENVCENLKGKFDVCLTDYERVNLNDIKQINLIGGDNTSFSIACASIVAKSTRDDLINEIHKQHPKYFFNNHQGYLTKKHLEVIKTNGIIKGVYRTNIKILKNLQTNYEK